MPTEFVSKQVLEPQKLNDVNDVTAGNQLAGGASGGAALYGLWGVRVLLDNVAALALSDTTIGTLYGGIYEYVGLLSGGTNAGVRGQIAFWATTQTGGNIFSSDGVTPYSVSADGSATTGDGLWAGVFINAITKGNFGWIQISGIASVLFQATPTDNKVGSVVVVNTAGVTVDSRADATAVTYGGGNGYKNILGVTVELPGTAATTAIKRISLHSRNWVY